VRPEFREYAPNFNEKGMIRMRQMGDRIKERMRFVEMRIGGEGNGKGKERQRKDACGIYPTSSFTKISWICLWLSGDIMRDGGLKADTGICVRDGSVNRSVFHRYRLRHGVDISVDFAGIGSVIGDTAVLVFS
jgi:hypothetical protein